MTSAAVREATKGRPRDETERTVRRSVGDAVFLFYLVVVLNLETFEVSKVKGLRAAATFYWMGTLLGGLHEPPIAEIDARERHDAWLCWRSVVERLSLDVRVHAAARTGLEDRYFGGRDVLFLDAASAWSGHVELVERLAGLAEVIESGDSGRPARRKPREGQAASLGARVEALASHLADDARVRAYEMLGDRERAVSIMERRLRA